MLELKDGFVKVGFAAETEDLIANAQQKLIKKRLAMICANNVMEADAGFAVDTNRITLLHADGEVEPLPLMSKREVSDVILDRVSKLLR